ncbi:MAG: hypothetical protein FD174_2391 [Geobacteraceae bacterium]|nr:MAG: hypothetical protein FD174_2391 [Geobacteraceae bacterium]
MKKLTLILLGLHLFWALGTSTVEASENRMTRGFFGGVKNSRMLVTTPSGGKEYFGVTGETKFVNPGRPGDISRLPRHSVVQVIWKDGVALQIVVVEVPR